MTSDNLQDFLTFFVPKLQVTLFCTYVQFLMYFQIHQWNVDINIITLICQNTDSLVYPPQILYVRAPSKTCGSFLKKKQERRSTGQWAARTSLHI